jgi:tripeptidyl-peptidase-1
MPTGRLLLAVLASSLTPAWSEPVRHEVPKLPGEWNANGGVVEADVSVHIRFSLHQRHLDRVREIALQVSDPASSMYGRYMGADEIRELTEPDPAHVTAIVEWLGAAGVSWTRRGEVVDAQLTVGAARELLGTEFEWVVHGASGQTAMRPGAFFLPKEVHDSVAAVYGLHGLPLPHLPSVAADPADPAEVTPAVIAQTYGVSGVTPSGTVNNRQAVAEFVGQKTSSADLKSFFARYLPNATDSQSSVYRYVGNHTAATGSPGVEAELDIEYIMGVAPGVLTEFWYVGSLDFCGDVKQWSSDILEDDAPLVHSVSYGIQGVVWHQLGCFPWQVADIDANFAKLAANGKTIIFASGDSGSGHTNGLFPWSRGALYPSWPASSPWVTAVGATRFVDQQPGQEEMAVDQFGSGGGFSKMFDAFPAQKAAVSRYLNSATDLPPQSMFPAGGRATPDVAALGEGYEVFFRGKVYAIGGTSASAPAFAAMISLLNEARLQAGMSPMGYLNPFLYQHPEAFTDVTLGTNAISRAGKPVKYGYTAAEGWDPVTGLGTPLFSKLLSSALEAGGAIEPVIV